MDEFGRALALEANYLFVGSPGRTLAGNARAGGVDSFFWNGAGAWELRDDIAYSIQAAGDEFGSSLDYDHAAGHLAIGAPAPGQASPGRAYCASVVDGMAGITWGLVGNGTDGSLFGTDVAVQGEDCMAGAPLDDGTGVPAGLAYFYNF